MLTLVGSCNCFRAEMLSAVYARSLRTSCLAAFTLADERIVANLETNDEKPTGGLVGSDSEFVPVDPQ